MGEAVILCSSEIENLKSGEELITDMQKWFRHTVADKSYAENCMSGSGAAMRIQSLSVDDIVSIEISSLIDYEEEGFGSDITYNFETGERKRKNTGWSC